MKAVKIFFKLLLAVFFIGSGILHFALTARNSDLVIGTVHMPHDFYLKIMPDYIPWHAFMIYLSGATEIIAGVMLLVPSLSVWGAWFIIAHLVVFFTVHFWMIQHASDKYSDVPLALLWFRIVMQIVFIVWAWWFVAPGGGKAAKKAA